MATEAPITIGPITPDSGIVSQPYSGIVNVINADVVTIKNGGNTPDWVVTAPIDGTDNYQIVGDMPVAPINFNVSVTAIKNIIVADFNQVSIYPGIKSRFGKALNYNNLDGSIQGTYDYMVELGITSFNGVCEFNGWFKHGPGNSNPCISVTLDGNGRPRNMSSTPTSVLPNFVGEMINRGIKVFVQLCGPAPQYQTEVQPVKTQLTTPTDIDGNNLLLKNFIRGSNYPGAVNWILWNEPGHTLNGLKQGFLPDGTQFVESDADYAARRSPNRQAAVDIFWQMYAGVFSRSGASVGNTSTVNFATLLSGDTKTTNGRGTPDGNTYRAASFLSYVANYNSSLHKGMTYVCANDYGDRSPDILTSQGDYQGGKWPLIIAQSAASLLKAGNQDGGGDDDSPPPGTTKMGPALEDLTTRLADCAQTQIAIRHDSYWISNTQAGYLKNLGGGVYQKLHRYICNYYWSQMPARLVNLSNINQSPIGDGNLFAQQGLIGCAGIDPNRRRASIYIWNETVEPYTFLPSTLNLPAQLLSVTPTTVLINEANVNGIFGTWDGKEITLQSLEAIYIEWKLDDSVESRRNPLADATHTPIFTYGFDTYVRPRAASCYLDQIRGLIWFLPVSTYTNAISCGGQWSNLPDSIYLTLFVWAMDNPAAVFKVTGDFGAGDVTLFTSTVGALTQGQVVPLNLLTTGGSGWAAGTRSVKVTISHTGGANQRIETWLSGSLAKAVDLVPV